VTEKDIVLDVGRRLFDRLAEEPGITPQLTRSKDVFVNLSARARRAETARADLFVSVHVNGYRSRAPKGAEVFFLSLDGATDVAERELESLENAAVGEGADPVLGEIAELPFAVDLLKTDTVMRSSLLAESILNQLVHGDLAASRGVKQANFVVLRSCRVPSALVEVGFASNPEDAARLASETHRQALAEAITKGILEFRARYARHAPGEGGAAVGSAGAQGPSTPSR
jgi:N-acetylmuramoyl-L-alanine amidase